MEITSFTRKVFPLFLIRVKQVLVRLTTLLDGIPVNTLFS
jgi:hypothetical protein